MALQGFMALIPHILEAPPGARPRHSRNSPTCGVGSQLRAPAGPTSGSTRPSSGCKSLQGMPSGLSGSARGSFLGSVVERTGSGEQETTEAATPCTALLPPLRASSSSQPGAVNQEHLLFKHFHTFSLPDLAIRTDVLQLPFC